MISDEDLVLAARGVPNPRRLSPSDEAGCNAELGTITSSGNILPGHPARY